MRWDNILDSHPPPPADLETLEDVGAFSSLPNGDVLETGAMYNPKSGKNESYEEVWRRLPVPSGAEYFVLERGDGKAFLGRVGSLALGAAKVNDEYLAWRDELVEGAWKRKYAFGEGLDAAIPSALIEVPFEWVPGATVKFGGHDWIVRTAGSV